MKTTIRRAAIVLMIMTLMTATAFAGTNQVDAPQVNTQIQVQLETQVDKDSLVEEGILLIGIDANERILMEIDKAVIKAEAATNEVQIDAIMTNLQEKAAQISEVTIEKIERLGGEAICEWVEVNIGGEIIQVDPIRIVRLR